MTGGAGVPFTPGAGTRDVDVLRDVLGPGETLAIADSPAAPALVVISRGTVSVAGDPAGAADLAAGTNGTFDGYLTLVNTGIDQATVVGGLVGAVRRGGRARVSGIDHDSGAGTGGRAAARQCSGRTDGVGRGIRRKRAWRGFGPRRARRGGDHCGGWERLFRG